MPAPSLTELAKLMNLGLMKHYQIHQKWYIQQARVLVANARFAVTVASKASSGIFHTFTPDEVAVMLRAWLMVDPQWQNMLRRKPNLALGQYDLITDSMARHVAWNAYIAIVS